MQLFYCPDIISGTYTLPEEESRHCVRVLRLTRGDLIHITDGRGSMHECRIADDHPKHCTAEIIRTEHSTSRAPSKVHIAIAPTKNLERLEWFLEKATEIGVDEITPIWCEHSERTVVKIPRLEKVMVAAMKQSLKSWLPKLNEPVEFSAFISIEFPGRKFIAYYGTGHEQHLKTLAEAGKDQLVLVGPEGDFSLAEVKLAAEHAFIPVSLGSSRLRTETAGVVACTVLNL